MIRNTRRFLSTTSLALSLAAGAAPAAAATYVADILTFTALSGSANLPDGYGGFTWGDRWFTNPTESAPATAAAPYLTLGGSTSGSLLIRRADGSGFYFDGADFWSRRGVDGIGDFSFVLYGENGETLYNGDVDPDQHLGRLRFDRTPTLMTANYTGLIGAMAFFFDNDDYDHLAMDNFRFRALAPDEPTDVSPVPEPGVYALLTGGLVMVGWFGRRRRLQQTD